jgi:hypothetical protein
MQRKWLRQAEVDAGDREGTATAPLGQILELNRRNSAPELVVKSGFVG